MKAIEIHIGRRIMIKGAWVPVERRWRQGNHIGLVTKAGQIIACLDDEILVELLPDEIFEGSNENTF